VGEEVRQQFIAHDSQAAQAFVPSSRPGHWLADIYLLAGGRIIDFCGLIKESQILSLAEIELKDLHPNETCVIIASAKT